jgi:hypothetical protein
MAYTTINKSSDYFNTKLWTGNDTDNTSITGITFQPDLVWVKNRTSTNSHALFDAVRGATKYIESDTTDAEATGATFLKSFDSDGFTLGSGGRVNADSQNYCGWNWKANGQGSANTAGSINTTYTSVNTTAGFSISKYTGTGSNATVGHGLGAVPKMIITKNLQQGNEGWQVYHETQGNTKKCALNETGGFATDATAWNSTTPTNNVFYIGTNWGGNGNGHPMIAYCFAEKTGYSKFGSYVGNGNADGTFIYTGFKPAWILTKKSSASGDSWNLHDSTRSPANPANKRLTPDANTAEADSAQYDLLSNGFKALQTTGSTNGSGSTYIYMAFAEAPLVGTNGVTAKAR